MKTKMNFLKTTVMAIALMGAAQGFAQVTPGEFPNNPTLPITQPSDLNGGLVTYDGVDDDADGTDEDFMALGGTTMFYRPTGVNTDGSIVNLSASLTDDDGDSFSNYLWYKVSYTGGTESEGTAVYSSATNTFSPTNLEPGYNKFRVRGETGSSVSSCPSNEYQDVIVFVLPELNVVPAVTGTELVYCLNNVPTGADEITLSANITADYTDNNNDYPKPGVTNAATDFTLTYEWHAVETTTLVDQVIGTGASPVVSLTTAGTYEFYVNVKYHDNIRTANVGGVNRPYVVYGGSTIATSQTVVVTDTPSTPEITVINVED